MYKMNEKLSETQKAAAIAILLEDFGFSAASEDCDKTNYDRYAKWVVKHMHSSYKRTNVETRVITINKELRAKVLDAELQLKALLEA